MTEQLAIWIALAGVNACTLHDPELLHIPGDATAEVV